MGTVIDNTRHLVIGSTGLLGSALCGVLEQSGVSPSTMDRQCAGWAYANRFMIEDLESLPDDFDVIYLVAAAIPWGQMDTPDEAVFLANALLPARVVSHFKKARVVFASSVAVYGTSRNAVVTVSDGFSSPNFYARTKLAGETAVACHPAACIIRFSSLFGPGMRANSFLPSIVRQAIAAKKIRLFGNGGRLQNYLEASRAAAMMVEAGRVGLSGVYHGVVRQSFSNLDVAKLVCEAVPGTTIVFEGEDAAASAEYCYSPELEPKTMDEERALRDGIRSLVEFELGNRREGEER